jgi:CheY-like chemotaxis protein
VLGVSDPSGDETRARALGVSGYFEKPVEPRDLLSLLVEHLQCSE